MWGAGVEAVWPKAAKLNWPHTSVFLMNADEKRKYEDTMNSFRTAQNHYFGQYFKTPAVCPGANRTILRGRGRHTDGHGTIAVSAGARNQRIAGVTSECELVEHLAGLVDHLYYSHGMSRLEIADIVKTIEETRTMIQMFKGFDHFQVN